jgi:hypothetical protein
METFIYFQCFISFFVSAHTLYINTFLYEWASLEAIQYTIPILCSYFIFDTIIGFKTYIKSDPLILIHHMLFLSACIVLYCFINIHGYDNDMYRITRWVMSMEITSMFNSVRLFLNDTKFKHFGSVLFGVIFLGIRTLATVGIYYDVIHNKYYVPISVFAVMITMLNVTWCSMIIQKAKKEPVTDYSIEQWNRITRVTVFIIPMAAICLLNNEYYCESGMVCVLFIISVLYHYGEKYLRVLDILICFLVSVCWLTIGIAEDRTNTAFLFASIILLIYCLTFNKKYENLHGIIHVMFYIGTICILEL